MKITDFILDKIMYIFTYIGVLAIIEFYLFIYQTNDFIKILVAFLLTLGIFICLLTEYLTKKKYYDELNKIINSMDKKYLFTEVINKPVLTEEKLFVDSLTEINKATIEEINSYKEEIKEYKEYIEMWVHEIKTPLSTAKLIIENNKNKVADGIEDELEKIDEYISQCLYHSKIDSVNDDYIVTETTLERIVADVIKENKKILITQKVKIVMKDLDIKVNTDAKWIKFVLGQLISNSLKYKSNNPIFKFTAYKNKENIVFKFEDNGIGIKEAEICKVFNKGFIGTNGRKKEASTGMGLYICKKLIEKMGDKISISSEENKGTTIDIIFPLNSYISEVK